MKKSATEIPAAPLLTICIPTYKGAHFLKVTLEALLPQAREAGESVEVLVIDDVSPDNTAEVVEEARKHGPVRYIRNEKNLGIIRNEVNAILTHATGEFVWAWNQHCLIYPGALAKVIQILHEHRHLDAFYVNFRCAEYPRDWPESARGGFHGQVGYLGSLEVANRHIERWQTLLDVNRNVDGTQSYAHIAKKKLWTKYWKGRAIGCDFTTAETTYPHACVVAAHMVGKASYYIGTPLITIYNGAQTWGTLDKRARVVLIGYPDLLTTYYLLGWNRAKYVHAQAHCAKCATQVITEMLRTRHSERIKLLRYFVAKHWHYKGLFAALWKAASASECCWLLRVLNACGARLERGWAYCFHNCRPVRWLKSHAQRHP